MGPGCGSRARARVVQVHVVDGGRQRRFAGEIGVPRPILRGREGWAHALYLPRALSPSLRRASWCTGVAAACDIAEEHALMSIPTSTSTFVTADRLGVLARDCERELYCHHDRRAVLGSASPRIYWEYSPSSMSSHAKTQPNAWSKRTSCSRSSWPMKS